MADIHGNKTGGRDKGARNSRTEKVIELIEQSELSPIEFDLAVLNWDLEKLGISKAQEEGIDTRTQLEMRQNASKNLKPYAYPTLKSTEIKMDDDSRKALTLAYANPKQP